MTISSDPPRRARAPSQPSGVVAEHIPAWRCIGCGKIEAPQPCIGVCQDRRMELVDAEAYDEVAAQGEKVRCQLSELSGLLRRLAFTTPRGGEWERSYKALQAQARALLDVTDKRAG